MKVGKRDQITRGGGDGDGTCDGSGGGDDGCAEDFLHCTACLGEAARRVFVDIMPISIAVFIIIPALYTHEREVVDKDPSWSHALSYRNSPLQSLGSMRSTHAQLEAGGSEGLGCGIFAGLISGGLDHVLYILDLQSWKLLLVHTVRALIAAVTTIFVPGNVECETDGIEGQVGVEECSAMIASTTNEHENSMQSYVFHHLGYIILCAAYVTTFVSMPMIKKDIHRSAHTENADHQKSATHTATAREIMQTCCESYMYLAIIFLAEFTIFGCVGVMNFPLAYMLAVYTVPVMILAVGISGTMQSIYRHSQPSAKNEDKLAGKPERGGPEMSDGCEDRRVESERNGRGDAGNTVCISQRLGLVILAVGTSPIMLYDVNMFVSHTPGSYFSEAESTSGGDYGDGPSSPLVHLMHKWAHAGLLTFPAIVMSQFMAALVVIRVLKMS
jgi:hypothetical protein